jgi:hypothetical protein
MTAAANFKYYDESEARGGIRKEDEEAATESRLSRLLHVCLSSKVLKNPAAYIEMSKIFDRVSDVEIVSNVLSLVADAAAIANGCVFDLFSSISWRLVKCS